MRILFVGSLSWNPERFRSLAERGHELWGLWSRSMGWDQGPYPALEGCVRHVALADAARTIREQRIDCVYSLFQVYDPRLCAGPSGGIEHGVWTLLRVLLEQRHRGAFDVPIVRHWGFDVGNVDLDVARAFDAQIVCNREKLACWTTRVADGGCGLEVFDGCEVLDFLDSDRPKLEFMNDRFAGRLSDRDGEIHTVCVGRPFKLDFAAAARAGIHVHVYGNSYDDVCRTIARNLPSLPRRRSLLDRFLHVHAPLQPIGAGWAEVRRIKARWVEEFSRYDAGWSYIGNPLSWAPLEDAAAIPNRVSTYLLAGLPIVTDRRPGSFRYEELRRLGVGIELLDSDYGRLAAELQDEISTRRRSERAREEREAYSFDASIDPLLAILERARTVYHGRPPSERTRFHARTGRPPLVTLQPTMGIRPQHVRRRKGPPRSRGLSGQPGGP